MALVVLAVPLAAGTATLRATVLRQGFYLSVVDRSHTVERFYDEVLVDPRLLPLREDLSAGQAAALTALRSAVGVNVRLVLPPDSVRAIIASLTGELAAWLRGDLTQLRLDIPLDPIIANLRGLAAGYLSEVLDATPTLRTLSPASFRSRLAAAVSDLERGRLPRELPSLGKPSSRAEIDALLRQYVPPAARAALAPLIATAVRAGDGLDALLPALAAAVRRRADEAARNLRRLAHGRNVSLVALVGGIPDSTVRTVGTARQWFGTPLDVTLVLSWLVVLAGLALIGIRTARSTRARAGPPTAALGAGVLVSALLAGVLWWWLGSVIAGTSKDSWPPSVQLLVSDNAHGARLLVIRTWLEYTLAPALVVAVIWAVAALTAGRQPVAAPARRGHLAGRAAPVLAPLAAAALVGVAAAAPASAAQPCNGSVALCDRPYDTVTVLATHNSMSSSADNFLFPLQDTDILTQLNAGARGLLLDGWQWESPGNAVERLAGAGLPPRAVRAVRHLLAAADPSRPGLWFCHNVCRLGALPMVATLRRLRDWLDRNPREVVTVVLQDETAPQRIVAAVRQAGLVPYLATPPADPHGRWPTLGQLIARGHRLVIFTERATGAAPWLQNYYRYAEETPYTFRSLAAMGGAAGCTPNRGGSGKPLFLLNNFITQASGSRELAAQANSAAFLRRRLETCLRVRHRLPTTIATDFTTLGAAQRVVNDINRAGARALRTTTPEPGTLVRASPAGAAPSRWDVPWRARATGRQA